MEKRWQDFWLESIHFLCFFVFPSILTSSRSLYTHLPSFLSSFLSFPSLPPPLFPSKYSMSLLIRRELKITAAHHPGNFLWTLWTNLSNSIKPMPGFSPIICLSAVWSWSSPEYLSYQTAVFFFFFNNSFLISPSSVQLCRTHSIRVQTLQLTVGPAHLTGWRNPTRPTSQWVTDSFSSTLLLVFIHYIIRLSQEEAQSNLCNYLPAKSRTLERAKSTADDRKSVNV